MVKLTDEQRPAYEARNRRLLAAVRAGVLYRLIAERFGLSRGRDLAVRDGVRRHLWPGDCAVVDGAGLVCVVIVNFAYGLFKNAYTVSPS